MADNIFDQVPTGEEETEENVFDSIDPESGTNIFDSIPTEEPDEPAAAPLAAEAPKDDLASAISKDIANTPTRWKNIGGGVMSLAGDDKGGLETILKPLADAKNEGREPGFMDYYATAKNALMSGSLLSSLTRQAADPDSIGAKTLKKMSETGRKISADAQKELEKNKVNPDSLTTELASGIVSGTIDMMPMLTAGRLGGSTAASTVFGGQVGGQSYADMLKEGNTQGMALAKTQFDLLAEVIPEKVLVIDVLLKPGSSFIKRFINSTFGEGVQEGFTEIMQNAYDDIELEGMTFIDAVQNIDWEQVAKAMTIGAGVGGALAGPAHLMDRGAAEGDEPAADELDLIDPFQPEGFNPTFQAGEVPLQPVTQNNGEVVPGEFWTADGYRISQPDAQPIPVVEEQPADPFDVDAQADIIKSEVMGGTAPRGTGLPEVAGLEDVAPILDIEGTEPDLPAIEPTGEITDTEGFPAIATAPEAGIDTKGRTELEQKRGSREEVEAYLEDKYQLNQFAEPETFSDKPLQNVAKLKAARKKIAKEKKDIEVKPSDILKDIAKAGGINRQYAEGVDPAEINIQKGGFHRVFPKNGGKSMDEMGEVLWEMGYFQNERPDANEVIDLVNAAMRGEEIYTLENTQLKAESDFQTDVYQQQLDRIDTMIEEATTYAQIQKKDGPEAAEKYLRDIQLEKQYQEYDSQYGEEYLVEQTGDIDLNQEGRTYLELMEQAEQADPANYERTIDSLIDRDAPMDVVAAELYQIIEGKTDGKQQRDAEQKQAAPGREAGTPAKTEKQTEVDRRQADQEVKTDKRKGDDRRHDQAAREKVKSMSREELEKLVLEHELTGIKNRFAFKIEHKFADQFVSVDADSLKWVNDNMTPDNGDRMLQAVADALVAEFGYNRVYHISGDEFYVLGFGDTESNLLKQGMKRVDARLSEAQLKVEKDDGTKIELTGLVATAGHGESKVGADNELKQTKIEKEQRKERAARGEAPPGAVIKPAEGKQDQQDRAATDEGQTGETQAEEPARVKRGRSAKADKVTVEEAVLIINHQGRGQFILKKETIEDLDAGLQKDGWTAGEKAGIYTRADETVRIAQDGDVIVFDHTMSDTELLTMADEEFLAVTEAYSELFDNQRPPVNYTLKKNKPPVMSQKAADAVYEEWQQFAKEVKPGKHGGVTRTVLSLFDAGGSWADPWRIAGYETFSFDIQNGIDLTKVGPTEMTEDFNIYNVDFVLAACPCTDFASVSAWTWNDKDIDGRTEASIELVHRSLDVIDYFQPKGWALENPTGRIQRMTGLPEASLVFQPHNFGEPHTKKTFIYGNFENNMPTTNVLPTKKGHIEALSGTGRGKIERSETPTGFAWSMFVAQHQDLFDAWKAGGPEAAAELQNEMPEFNDYENREDYFQDLQNFKDEKALAAETDVEPVPPQRGITQAQNTEQTLRNIKISDDVLTDYLKKRKDPRTGKTMDEGSPLYEAMSDFYESLETLRMASVDNYLGTTEWDYLGPEYRDLVNRAAEEVTLTQEEIGEQFQQFIDRDIGTEPSPKKPEPVVEEAEEVDEFTPYDGKEISYDVEVEETGEVLTVDVDAGSMMRETSDRVVALKSLLECVL